MLDDALAGTFSVRDYDETIVSKIESKMAKLLDASRSQQARVADEQRRVHSLISDISHQTRTPLANVSLYAQLLMEQGLDEPQARLARQIVTNTEKLDFLIQQLVNTSRLESGLIRMAPRLADARELIRAAAAGCESDADSKGIRLVAAVGDSPLMASFDPRWCGEALVNIIDNAIKYTPAGGEVRVCAVAYEMFVRIDVADSGRGIAEADLPKVFGRFWRAVESADHPGAGLGLYLARQIVTGCGGYIHARSAPGRGSVFSVFLSKVKDGRKTPARTQVQAGEASPSQQSGGPQ
ncbi:MAG: HAMP domain-containing histidine kinase [Propionibacteriaceae bacterium]|nr:HAMP domain-containing histidine kinase [Propionibacteriaceae bacterium]